MTSWKTILAGVVSDVEGHFDSLKYRLTNLLDGDDPIQILPYRSYGNHQVFTLRGRVLEKVENLGAEDNDSVWDNLVDMYRRFDSDEVPHARIKVTFQDTEQIIQANEEGYFTAQLPLKSPLAESISGWQTVHYELLVPQRDHPITAIGQVLVPPTTAEYGIISDLDDTVLQSHVGNLIKMAHTAFLNNANTRLPFSGVAKFYEALQQGTTVTHNPIFYVSNSPWNLYDLLMDFFQVRGIPLSPLFLTDWGFSDNYLFTSGGSEHKKARITELLTTYPELTFILIGDSTEHDPDIYLDIAFKFPKRISTIYIQDVKGIVPKELELFTQRGNEAEVDILFVPDTFVAAQHAVEQGYIPESALEAVLAERNQDDEAPIDALGD